MPRRLALAFAALLLGAAPSARADDLLTKGSDPFVNRFPSAAEAAPGSAPPSQGAVPAAKPALSSPSADPALPSPAQAAGAAPAAASPPPPVAAGPPRRRALWVLAEGSQRVLEHRERLDLLLADARALGATDLFVQVYRGGRAWFDSSLADPTPWQASWRDPTPGGADALSVLIARAHAQGLRVHAWVNVLSLASNPTAPILRDLGAGAVLVDQWGRSLLDYPGFDVPEPDRRHVPDRDARRLPRPRRARRGRAPDRHLRGARTPLPDARRPPPRLHPLPRHAALRARHTLRRRLSTSATAPATRARFRAETGLVAPFADTLANATRFDDWRREQLTALVARIRERAAAARPGIAMSAAVLHDDERAYLTVFQDWRGWLEAGLLDFAVPMLYSTDERMLRYRVSELAGLPEASRIWVGLGSWLFGSEPGRAVAQARLVEATGALGLSLFSWDSIREAPALREALARAATGAAPAREPAALDGAATSGDSAPASPSAGARVPAPSSAPTPTPAAGPPSAATAP